MDTLKFAWTRISSLFKKRAIENDMEKEMQFHVDMLVQEYEDAGMSNEDARIAARRRFGNMTRLKEQGRDIKGGGILDEFRQDLHYGVRLLRRSPGFASTRASLRKVRFTTSSCDGQQFASASP